MSTSNLKELTTLLAEKARLLETARERLTQGQKCIIEADIARLDDATSKAGENFIRLNEISSRFGTLLSLSCRELGLSEKGSLSTFIAAIGPERSSELRKLQERCISAAGAVSSILGMNEALLKNSLDLVGRSLTLFSSLLCAGETYGAGGRISSGKSAAGIVCREI
jgi:hypothetical protein